MGEPRKPTPMTPERAGQIGDRWRVAGVVLIILTGVLIGFGVEDVLLPAFAGLIWCVVEQSDHYGWRRGYLAREREERAEAERSLRGESR